VDGGSQDALRHRSDLSTASCTTGAPGAMPRVGPGHRTCLR